jgi:hypothetical protein
LRTADGSTLNLGLERSVALEDLQGLEAGVRGARIRFEHTLVNRSGRTLEEEVGLWSILQVPAVPEGTAFLPAGPYRLCFGQVPEGWARTEGGRPALRTAPAQRYKVGLPCSGPEAALSHLRAAENGDRPPDYAELPGDVLQLYNSPLAGKEAFCELECHAPAPVLGPGESQCWPVEFLVLKGPQSADLGLGSGRPR